jgi:hypothetical protein
VKLLAPALAALEALEAQKQYSYLSGGAVFLNPRTGAAWEGDQPIRHGVWTGIKAIWRSLSPSVPDLAFIRIHDADSR